MNKSKLLVLAFLTLFLYPDLYAKTVYHYRADGRNLLGTIVRHIPGGRASIIAGYVFDTDYDADQIRQARWVVFKVDNHGAIQWQRFINDPNAATCSMPLDMVLTKDGNVVVSGIIGRSNTDPAVGNSAGLVKLDAATGNVLWQRKVRSNPATAGGEVFRGLAELPDGRIVAAGHWNYAQANARALVCVFSPSGVLQYGEGFQEPSGSAGQATDFTGIAYDRDLTGNGTSYAVYLLGRHASPVNGFTTAVLSYRVAAPGATAGALLWAKDYDFGLGNVNVSGLLNVNNVFTAIRTAFPNRIAKVDGKLIIDGALSNGANRQTAITQNDPLGRNLAQNSTPFLLRTDLDGANPDVSAIQTDNIAYDRYKKYATGINSVPLNSGRVTTQICNSAQGIDFYLTGNGIPQAMGSTSSSVRSDFIYVRNPQGPVVPQPPATAAVGWTGPSTKTNTIPFYLPAPNPAPDYTAYNLPYSRDLYLNQDFCGRNFTVGGYYFNNNGTYDPATRMELLFEVARPLQNLSLPFYLRTNIETRPRPSVHPVTNPGTSCETAPTDGLTFGQPVVAGSHGYDRYAFTGDVVSSLAISNANLAGGEFCSDVEDATGLQPSTLYDVASVVTIAKTPVPDANTGDCDPVLTATSNSDSHVLIYAYEWLITPNMYQGPNTEYRIYRRSDLPYDQISLRDALPGVTLIPGATTKVVVNILLFADITETPGTASSELYIQNDCTPGTAPLARRSNPEQASGAAATVAGGLRLSPNPTHGSVTVTSGDQPIQRVEVFDMVGRSVLLRKEIGQQEWSCDLSHLPAGMYLLRVNNRETFKVNRID